MFDILQHEIQSQGPSVLLCTLFSTGWAFERLFYRELKQILKETVLIFFMVWPQTILNSASGSVSTQISKQANSWPQTLNVTVKNDMRRRKSVQYNKDDPYN